MNSKRKAVFEEKIKKEKTRTEGTHTHRQGKLEEKQAAFPSSSSSLFFSLSLKPAFNLVFSSSQAYSKWQQSYNVGCR